MNIETVVDQFSSSEAQLKFMLIVDKQNSAV